MQSKNEKIPLPRLLLHKQFIRNYSKQNKFNEKIIKSNINSKTSEEHLNKFKQPIDLSFANKKVINLTYGSFITRTNYSFKNSSNASSSVDSSIFESIKKNKVTSQPQCQDDKTDETYTKMKQMIHTETHEPNEKYENSFPIDLLVILVLSFQIPQNILIR